MKGLKKVALASAIAAVSAGAQAELKALDDSQMGELTGQAGLTIDVETKWSIGEFQYKDAGSVLLTGISMGGNTNEGTSSYLDNIRMTIDVAGAGAVDGGTIALDTLGNTSAVALTDNNFNYGFSEIKGLALVHASNGNTDAGILAAASLGADSATGLLADDRKTYGDGDLVIHWGFTDAWQKAGGFAAVSAGVGAFTLAGATYAQARDTATRAVDFNFAIDAIGLASSAYTTGANATAVGEWVRDPANTTDPVYAQISESFNDGVDADTTDTVLISGLNINGYFGPADLHIENDGNGFGNEDPAPDYNGDGLVNEGNADSKITWGNYFRVTDLDVYLDIAGVLLEDVEIHNDRGDLSGIDGTSSFGFAHSIRTIYAVKDAVLHIPTGYVDGLALNTQFKGDLDIGALKFGDTDTSIGSIHLTDIESDTRWTISAH